MKMKATMKGMKAMRKCLRAAKNFYIVCGISLIPTLQIQINFHATNDAVHIM